MNAKKRARIAMLRLTRLLIVGLLSLPEGSCGAASAYLAGMDSNPENYIWAPVEDDATRQKSTPIEDPARHRQRKGEPFEKAEPIEDTAQPKKPEPVAQASQKNWQQDLKDCEALGAGADSAVKGAPTIARSEDAPLVARCMIEKGYRKVYQARTDLF